MTSNICAGILIMSRQGGSISSTARDAIIQCFKDKGLLLKFPNRINGVVTFWTMSQAMMGKVLERHLEDLELCGGLKKIMMTLDLDQAAIGWRLIECSISPEYGAQLLTRVIQAEVLIPLTRAILEKRVKNDSVVVVRVKDDRNQSCLTIESSQQH
ncbi:hypothetical protein PAXINDRAFT_15851 [Paxillus involutus ATCC 200175]|uniref:Unplaced genomic scaffold PAXINscaffold_62, whole genome shotgun sequence n=1 Tax=Paxillus involutus ATCC 200175 TaxID=664439 RepID=A0A0C9T695_PAXIN|nr:hypothetical protein PAXINDRAFT_15851 [Paxillus involutus ATCC 200175]